MNKIELKTIHCLFEQSGTFKNEFKKLGYTAYDYDILNDFNETDFQIDLFFEIELAYEGKKSIFDKINTNDLVFAFFPCTRFETQILLHFRGDSIQQKNCSDLQKLEKDLQLHNELHYFYSLITKLAIICLKRNIPLIIENPYSSQHYLTKYWALKPKIIDLDRTFNGDYYKKPTQYFFIGCEPKNNLFFEPIDVLKRKSIIHTSNKIERSLISSQYASRFIRTYIIDFNKPIGGDYYEG